MRKLPRTQYSIHPALAGIAAVAATGDVADAGLAHGGRRIPYPTPQQYAKVEAAYRAQSATTATPEAPPMPRQPPTMMAAMQRPDLNPEVRQRILHSLAPRPGLVRRHKFVFSSDGRREQHSPITHDFSVDVTPDLLTARVHGFELIGHSLPLAEWTLPPQETRLPWRYGWCASPGQRCIWLDLREGTNTTGTTTTTSAAARANLAPPTPSLLVAELPLPANPITHVWLSEQPEEGADAGRLFLHVRLARRVGAALHALLPEAPATDFVLELANLEQALGAFVSLPARFGLTRSAVVDVVVPEYAFAAAPPRSEPPLGTGAEQQAVDVAAFSMDDPHVLTLDLGALGVSAGLGAGFASPVWAAAVEGSLGRLVVAPPASAPALADRVSRVWDRLLAHRRFAQGEVSAGPRLTDVSLRWVGGATPEQVAAGRGEASFRFQLRATWAPGQFPFPLAPGPAGMSAPPQCPIVAVGTDEAAGPSPWHDAMPTMASLGAVPESILALEPDLLVLAASQPPAFAYPGLQPRVPPLSVGFGGSPDAYFRNLQTPAMSLLLVPRGGPSVDPSFWQIPVRVGYGAGDVSAAVSVPSGEYSAEGLAAAITAAFAANPATSALRIRASYVAETGFAFASEVGALFSLAWQATDGQYVDPARLGYRAMDETGASAYSPHADAAGYVVSAFAAADLGLGAPSPPPLVPTVVAVDYSLRSQLLFQAKPAERVAEQLPGLVPLSLVTVRAARYHHLQPLRISVRVPAEGLLFGTAGFGSAEAAALEAVADSLQLSALASAAASSTALLKDAAAGPSAPVDPSLIPQFLALVHDPVAGAAGSLFDALVRLLGARGRGYGSAGVGPTGPMDADGPYRTVLALTSPEALPAVDMLLGRLADGIRVRRTVEALSTLLTRIIRGPVLRGVPLHLVGSSDPANPLGATLAAINGGIVSSGIALVLGRTGAISSSLSAAATAATTATAATATSPFKALVALYASAFPAVTFPGAVIYPGYPYLFDTAEPAPVAAGTLPVSAVSVPLPGIFVVSAPGTLAEAADARVELAGGAGASIPLADWRELGGAGSSLDAYAGSEVVVTHAAGLVPDAAQADAGILSWEVLGPDSVRIVLAHNIVGGTGVLFTWNGGATTTTITVTDSALTTLAKMLLVAGNYAVSVDAMALTSGTASSDNNPLVRPRTCDMVGTDVAPGLSVAPHLVLAELVQLALRTPPVPQVDPETGDPIAPLTASVSIGRLNEHPFSADWASSLPERIRPERLGYVLGEWTGDTIGAAAAATAVATSSATASALATAPAAFASVPGLPRLAYPLSTLFSPFAVDRSPPPYLLLDVELGTYGERYGVGSHVPPMQGGLGELMSLARITEPQLTRCVAYLPVGSDGSTLRLLDRQDDRSPVFFPTGATVGRIRFRILRPDGTPYDMGGRKVMFALRFFSRDDTPDAFQLGAGQQQQ